MSSDAARRQRDAGRRAGRAAVAAGEGGRRLEYGIVTAVHAGPPPTVDVDLSSPAGTVNAPTLRYLASYSPSVDDRVAVDVSPSGDALVLGSVAG